MKIAMFATAVLSLTLSSQALTFTFSPGHDLTSFHHEVSVTWGINWDLPQGQEITGAKLTVSDLYNWDRDVNCLFIHLLDDPKKGVESRWDTSWGWNTVADQFAGQGVLLGTWTDTQGGWDNRINYTYNFSAADLATLTSYLKDDNGWWNGDFGFGFDPDCYYYHSGITFEIQTGPKCVPPPSVPDGGSTLALLGLGFIAMLGVSRGLRAAKV